MRTLWGIVILQSFQNSLKSMLGLFSKNFALKTGTSRDKSFMVVGNEAWDCEDAVDELGAGDGTGEGADDGEVVLWDGSEGKVGLGSDWVPAGDGLGDCEDAVDEACKLNASGDGGGVGIKSETPAGEGILWGNDAKLVILGAGDGTGEGADDGEVVLWDGSEGEVGLGSDWVRTSSVSPIRLASALCFVSETDVKDKKIMWDRS